MLARFSVNVPKPIHLNNVDERTEIVLDLDLERKHLEPAAFAELLDGIRLRLIREIERPAPTSPIESLQWKFMNADPNATVDVTPEEGEMIAAVLRYNGGLQDRYFGRRFRVRNSPYIDTLVAAIQNFRKLKYWDPELLTLNPDDHARIKLEARALFECGIDTKSGSIREIAGVAVAIDESLARVVPRGKFRLSNARAIADYSFEG